jgi:hypothetical protein
VIRDARLAHAGAQAATIIRSWPERQRATIRAIPMLARTLERFGVDEGDRRIDGE